MSAKSDVWFYPYLSVLEEVETQAVYSGSVALVTFQLKKTAEELNEALATKDEIAQRCRELDMQVCTAILSPLPSCTCEVWEV